MLTRGHLPFNNSNEHGTWLWSCHSTLLCQQQALFIPPFRSEVLVLAQVADEETKAPRGCVSESVTGRGWPPAQGTLGTPPVFCHLFTPCLGRKPCSDELEEWPGFLVLSHLLTVFLSRAPLVRSVLVLSDTRPQTRCLAQREQGAHQQLGRRGGVPTKRRQQEGCRGENSWFWGYMAPIGILPSQVGRSWATKSPGARKASCAWCSCPGRGGPVLLPILHGGVRGGLHLAVGDTVLSAG